MTEPKDPLDQIKEHMYARLYRVERDYKVKMNLAKERANYDFERKTKISNEVFEFAIKYGYFSKNITISGQYLTGSSNPSFIWNYSPVGCYQLENVEIPLNKKPFIVHRWLMRVLLGIKWKDKN